MQKRIDDKCKCKSSTGSTHVECCNICGLPLPKETWHFILSNHDISRVGAVVIKGDSPSAVADLVDKIIVDEIKFVDSNLKENPDDLWWKAQLHRLQSVREKIIKATASL